MMKLSTRHGWVCCAAVIVSLLGQGAFGEEASTVGVVSHLNVVSDKSPDVSTLEAWKKAFIRDDMSDQEKAVAIFETMVRYRHQASPPDEFLSSGMAGGHVHDPLKTIHVYGYGQCCCAAGEVVGLARYLGMPARGRDITAHSVSEVFYDDEWHLIDCSVMNYFVKDDGKLASVDEIHQAVRAWFAEDPKRMELAGVDSKLRAFAKDGGWKQGPPLLAKADRFYGPDGVNSAGWHGWPSTMQEYYKVREPAEYTVLMGYQLNVQLRPGEKITRNFFSRGIEYTNNCSKDYYAELLDRKRLGIQTKLGDVAPGRIGDGSIEWTVPRSLEMLRAAAMETHNLASADSGVAPADAKEAGVLVLRFPSSYVYVKGSAVFNSNVPAGGAIAVSMSDNNGRDWTEIATIDKSGDQAIDLSNRIKRRYDYLLKFELKGQGTTLAGIRTSHDFQLSQAALPVITEGENQVTFSAGRQEGTITIEGSTELEQAREKGQRTIADFRPVLNGVGENLRMISGNGDATFDVTTPGEMTRIRVSTVWRARDQRDGWETLVSFNGGETFEPVEKGQMQGGTKGESRYIIIDNVPPGTRSAKVRFVGKQVNTTALFDLRIDADYKEPAGGFAPVKITYNWDEAGEEKSHEHLASTPHEAFSIRCGPGAVVKSYTLERME